MGQTLQITAWQGSVISRPLSSVGGGGGGGAGLVIASRWREAVKSPGDPKSEAYSCISTLWLAWHPWAAPYLEVVSPQINTGC